MKFDNPQDIWEGVPECQAHMAHSDEDCEYCVGEMQARERVLEKMSGLADGLIREVAQSGAQMPPWLMLEMRMDVLLETILRDPRDRMRYEGEVGRRMMVTLKNVQQQTKQPTIHVARDMPKGPLRNGR